MAHSILVTVTLPTTRKDGTPVTPADISEVDILRSTGGGPFSKIDSITSGTGPTVTFTDTTVVGGNAYEYEAYCIDTQTPPVTGDTSPPTAAVSVPLVLAPLGAPSVSASLQ